MTRGVSWSEGSIARPDPSSGPLPSRRSLLHVSGYQLALSFTHLRLCLSGQISRVLKRKGFQANLGIFRAVHKADGSYRFDGQANCRARPREKTESQWNLWKCCLPFVTLGKCFLLMPTAPNLLLLWQNREKVFNGVC